MASKQEWLEYLKVVKAYHKAYGEYVKALEKWIKKLPADGQVETADSGSNPPTPPPPPPGFP